MIKYLYTVLAVFLAIYVCAATAPSFDWVPLQTPAPADKALNIIFTAEGYTASQRTIFLADCQELMDGFSNKEPWKTYISHINFYASWVVSNQEGVSILNGAQVDTAFKAQVDTTVSRGGLSVGAIPYSAYVQTLPIKGYDFVIVNSTEFDRANEGGYAMLTVWDRSNMAGHALHEAGHTIGGLSDEYLGGGFCIPLKNVCTDLNNIPWRAWIDSGVAIPTIPTEMDDPVITKVGAFQGAYISTAYRSTYQSIMMHGATSSEYGPVNSEALILAIYSKTGPMLSITPAAGAVRIAAGQHQDFAPVVWAAPTTIGVLWYLDGAYYKTAAVVTLQSNDLTVGVHTLKCVVKDTTAMVRNDPSGLLTSTTTWTVVAGNFPYIASQPLNLSVTTGQAATFSVTATGDNLAYQWRKGGTAISGATSATYAITAAQLSDAGSYDCMLTNTAGTVTTTVATLTVTNDNSSSSSSGGGGGGGGAGGVWYLSTLAGGAILRAIIKRKA